MFQELFAEVGCVDVHVDLSGGYGLVAEHCLNGSQIGPTFEQAGGETMAESVGTDGLLYSSQFHQLLYHVEHHDARQVLLAQTADEHVVFVAGFDVYKVPVVEIETEFVDGTVGDGDEPLFGAFAEHLEKAFVGIEVGHPKIAEFAHSESATEEHFYDGAVSLSFGLGEVDD